MILIAIFSLLSNLASATPEFTGVASQSMGGTGRAAVQASEVGLLNPASLSFVRGYNIASAYRNFQTHDDKLTRNVLFHASENQAGAMFPLAVTYLKTRYMNSSYFGTREDIHLSTSDMVLKNLSFGIDVGRYSYQPEGGVETKEWDLKTGILYAATENLGIGLVFTNLLDTDMPFLKRGVEFGINYLFEDFLRMALDATYQMEDNPSKEGVIMLGMEHMYLDQIPLRLGFRWDDPNNGNYWTFGFGWLAPKVGFGYTFEKNASVRSEYGHSVDLKIYF